MRRGDGQPNAVDVEVGLDYCLRDDFETATRAHVAATAVETQANQATASAAAS